MALRQRVFVVQRADRETGQPIGEPIAAKLTRGAAQVVAKKYAPSRVTALWADKSEDLQQHASSEQSGEEDNGYQST
jgi:hypothetical protein